LRMTEQWKGRSINPPCGLPCIANSLDSAANALSSRARLLQTLVSPAHSCDSYYYFTY
jgi:hypothetical protein